MEAEDIQRLRQEQDTQTIRDKQTAIGEKITTICNELQMVRNAVIHARDYDNSTESKLDAIMSRLNKIQDIK